jgi:hypothetical protein
LSSCGRDTGRDEPPHPALLHGKKFDAGEIGDRLEAVVCGDKDVLGRLHGQIQGKGVCVGDFAVDTKLARVHGSFGSYGNDLKSELSKILQSQLLRVGANTLPEASGNFAPLDCRDIYFGLVRSGGLKNATYACATGFTVDIAEYG